MESSLEDAIKATRGRNGKSQRSKKIRKKDSSQMQKWFLAVEKRCCGSMPASFTFHSVR